MSSALNIGRASLHVLDYVLKGPDGREYNYDVALRQACLRLGVPCRIHLGRHADEGLRRSLDANALFTGGWDALDASNPKRLLQQLTRLNQDFFNDLKPLGEQVDAESVVFVPSIRPDRLLGLQTWLATLPADRRPRLVIGLRENMSGDPVFRSTQQSFAALGSIVRFCCDTEELQAPYLSAGCPVELLPLPLPPADHPSPLQAVHPAIRQFLDGGTAPVVGFFGPARWGKGFHLLPEVIGYVAELFPDVRWLIQSPRVLPAVASQATEAIAKAFAALQNLAEQTETVLWVDNAVAEEEYRGLMAGADIVLLPYVADRYRVHCSNIFAEAVGAAKVTVAPADSWLARQATRFETATTLFRDTHPAAIAMAVAQAIARFDPARRQAMAAQQAWLGRHSADAAVAQLLRR